MMGMRVPELAQYILTQLIGRTSQQYQALQDTCNTIRVLPAPPLAQAQMLTHPTSFASQPACLVSYQWLAWSTWRVLSTIASQRTPCLAPLLPRQAAEHNPSTSGGRWQQLGEWLPQQPTRKRGSLQFACRLHQAAHGHPAEREQPPREPQSPAGRAAEEGVRSYCREDSFSMLAHESR